MSQKQFEYTPSYGLIVSNKTWKNIHKSKAIKKRALLAHKKGINFYCFPLDYVNWNNNQVEAYYLDPVNDLWIKKTVPVPLVIHDRGSIPGPDTIKSFSKKGSVRNLLWINTTRTFGKWETYKALSSNKITMNCIPETAFLTFPMMTRFLKKYRYCYIKSNYGRRGRGVFRIERNNNEYLCKTGGNSIKSWHFNNSKKLYAFLVKTLGKMSIIQQGISLAEINSSPFDMRILVQKNINNKWVISGLNFRIARPGAIVTNFAAGASDIFIAPGQKIPYTITWYELENFALNIVKSMEKYFGRLGEIGLDVGIDKKGKLWLIEANSRPSSIAYREAPEDACNQIFGLPLDYSYYLLSHYTH